MEKGEIDYENMEKDEEIFAYLCLSFFHFPEGVSMKKAK